ncbi:hypothetical protein P691DRAFT_618535, partial [Macrolepiota fuliginosa MF-IS2]
IVLQSIPFVIDLHDCCHTMHNTTKDIMALSDFKSVISMMSWIINYFSKSPLGTTELAQLHEHTGVSEGLVKIGKTQFATHYSAAVALAKCLPIIQSLIE